jgi:hypothetical protein
MATDRVIRWSTALAVLGVAAVAAVASYEHANDLVWAHGESGWTARMSLERWLVRVVARTPLIFIIRIKSCQRFGAPELFVHAEIRV